MQVSVVTLGHDLLPEVSLPDALTLGQLVAVLQSKGLPLGSPFLEMKLNLGTQEIGASSKTDSSKSREAKEGTEIFDGFCLSFRVSWPSGLDHQVQVLVVKSFECGFWFRS